MQLLVPLLLTSLTTVLAFPVEPLTKKEWLPVTLRTDGLYFKDPFGTLTDDKHCHCDFTTGNPSWVAYVFEGQKWCMRASGPEQGFDGYPYPSWYGPVGKDCKSGEN